MDDVLRLSLLYDFYESLLTKKQAEVFEMYYFDDFSLNEIAEKYSTSRQAVADIIRRTEKALSGYERKLELLDKHLAKKAVLENINSILDRDFRGSHGIAGLKEMINSLL